MLRQCTGALKTLGANKDTPLPVRLFEASDVILLDDGTESGARNERRLAAVVCSKESGFEIIHGLLNRIMEVLGVPITGEWCLSRMSMQNCAPLIALLDFALSACLQCRPAYKV